MTARTGAARRAAAALFALIWLASVANLVHAELRPAASPMLLAQAQETRGSQSLQSAPVAPVTLGQEPLAPAQAPAGSTQGRGTGALPGGADVPQAGDAIAQLRRFVAEVKSARGNFSQQTLRAAGRAPESASGVFAFSRPGRFRWEVRQPFEQLMVADGEKLWFLDADLNQVIERKLSDSLGASPAAILFGGGQLEQAFNLQEIGQRDGLDWLQAMPKSRDAGFERISIGFREGMPAAMEVLDAFGRTTRFSFTGLERNPVLEAELFRFVVPKGADLIRQ